MQSGMLIDAGFVRLMRKPIVCASASPSSPSCEVSRSGPTLYRRKKAQPRVCGRELAGSQPANFQAPFGASVSRIAEFPG
jgi:hypothetical protein